MFETRDLVIKWPCWHKLVFSCEITIDMRYACLVQRARSVCWISVLEEVGSEA